MKYAILGLALLSPFFFPWPLSALLALIAAFYFPAAPFACGVLLDALSYAHGAYRYPLFSMLGALASLAALFVHRFVETSIMRA